MGIGAGISATDPAPDDDLAIVANPYAIRVSLWCTCPDSNWGPPPCQGSTAKSGKIEQIVTNAEKPRKQRDSGASRRGVKRRQNRRLAEILASVGIAWVSQNFAESRIESHRLATSVRQ